MLAVLLMVGVAACARREEPASAVGDPLPAAEPHPVTVVARMRDALARRAVKEPARTRHLRPDGTPRYVNRLVLERSPYLRQHAHNPVDWYPWGDEAFARARRDGKLILLSIGYATCHWCHVMEEESFDDEGVAARLNADYVAVKVDREERPDVDGTYMQALLALTGRGGWPMTVWLTPDRQILFAGTYFPPEDGQRGARLGFKTLLARFADRQRADPAGLLEEGRTLSTKLAAAGEPEPLDEAPGRSVLDAAFARYRSAFDVRHGGFGGAPKFPMPAVIEFLLRYHRRTREPESLAMARRTLEGLAAGGVRDQLGGGFHRYAIDAAWRIPHFEKMLYDNAQLATVYVSMSQVTGDATFAAVAREILDDLLRTFHDSGGGFYAAIDADDPGGEGAFYTWTPEEIAGVLPPETARVAAAHFGVDPAGNFGGRSVLFVAGGWEALSTDLGSDGPDAGRLVAAGRTALRSARDARPPPLVDTKVLASWNGLAIGAFARAGAVLGDRRYVATASAAAEFVLSHLRIGGRLHRVWADGAAAQPAFLDDYAFMASGLLDVFEATGDPRWVDAAAKLQATLDAEFWDAERGGFFESGATRDPVLPRGKPAYDGAVPSGNAVAAENLVRLAVLRGDDDLRARAAACVRAFGRTLVASPTSAPRLLGVLEALLDRTREVVIVAPAAGGDDVVAFLGAVHARYLPNRAIVVTREGPSLAALQRALPIIGEKAALDGRTTAYVCERGRCLRPTSDAAELGRQLDAVHPLGDPASPGD
jgi:uncharacterized protein YyaL (SSP411 family)